MGYVTFLIRCFLASFSAREGHLFHRVPRSSWRSDLNRVAVIRKELAKRYYCALAYIARNPWLNALYISVLHFSAALLLSCVHRRRHLTWKYLPILVIPICEVFH